MECVGYRMLTNSPVTWVCLTIILRLNQQYTTITDYLTHQKRTAACTANLGLTHDQLKNQSSQPRYANKPPVSPAMWVAPIGRLNYQADNILRNKAHSYIFNL